MFRFTLVTMQAVLDYFDIDADPNGLIMPTVLIVPGRHCRLENISPDETWREDEVMLIAGEKVERKQGEKVPPYLMRSWIHERAEWPDVFDPQQVRVWQQPAAKQDEVTMKWFAQLITELFPQAVWQTDLCPHCVTPGSKTALKLAHVLPAWILGGATPVAQLPQP